MSTRRRTTPIGWLFNLAVPIVAIGFAFAGIVSAQGEGSDGGLRPGADCGPTLTDDNVGYIRSGLTVVPSGDVLVSEFRAACIIRISPDGQGHFLIGGARRSDACPTCGVRLGRPADIEVVADGTVFVVDSGDFQVRAVHPDGTMDTVVGPGRSSVYPRALAQDSAGRIYIADDDLVYRLEASGTVVVAGGGGGDVGAGAPATSVRLTRPSALAVGPAGDVYIAQESLYRVLRVDPAGNISVFAGTGVEGDTGDGGPANKANLEPSGLAADAAGNVYIASQFGRRIRRVDPAGQITTFVGRGRSFGAARGDGGPALQASIDFPGDLAVHDGSLYILDGGSQPSVRKVDRAGTITTVAGGG